jgi:hypothetical protein
MSNFECSVKDLMSSVDKVSESGDENVPENSESIKLEGTPIADEKISQLNLSVYQRLYTDKNIKTILFITLVYLVLNSQQMYTFLSNNALFLFVEGSPGFLGKAVIGLMLGIIIAVFTSFFSF